MVTRPRICLGLVLAFAIGGLQAGTPRVAAQAAPIPDWKDAAGSWVTAANRAGVVNELDLSTVDGTPVVRLRRNDGESPFDSRSFSVGLPGASWDGRRLRISVVTPVVHNPSGKPTVGKRVDLDLVFERTQARWSGTLGRNGVEEMVELRRPGAYAVKDPSRFLGTWCALDDDYPPCFTLVAGPGGVPLGTTPRTGLVLDFSRGPRNLFFRERFRGICCDNWFNGRLTEDGKRIEGFFWFGKTPSNPQSVTYVKAR